MRQLFLSCAGMLLALGLMLGCARQAPAPAATDEVSLKLTELGRYDWRGDQFTPQDLRTQLVEFHKTVPFTAISVAPGNRPLSEMQKAQLGTLARELGAKAYIEVDGKRQEIKLGQ